MIRDVLLTVHGVSVWDKDRTWSTGGGGGGGRERGSFDRSDSGGRGGRGGRYGREGRGRTGEGAGVMYLETLDTYISYLPTYLGILEF